MFVYFVSERQFSLMLFNELYRFLNEIETDNLTVSNSEIITLDFTVLKHGNFMKSSYLFVDLMTITYPA